MKNKIYETIIIGAGISGLACARKLHENGKEFLIISKDIGGRILTSEDGKVNYGAYCIADNWHNIKRFTEKTRKLCFEKVYYHDTNLSYNFYLNMNTIICLLQLIKVLYLFYKFKKHLEVFRKKCETTSQAQALKEDPFLFNLYNQNALDFVREHNIEEFAKTWWFNILPNFYFLPFHKLDAFHVLLVASGYMIATYEVMFQKEKMIDGIRNKILSDNVIQIKKKGKVFSVKTKKKVFQAKKVVVATPIHISKRLLNLKEIKRPTTVHVLHVSGKIREHWKRGLYHFFADEESLYGMAKQSDESYVIWAKKEGVDLERYFYKYKIIAHKFWNPAFNFEGNALLECEQNENLYMIGDYNLMNVEDAHITGIYAANRIIKGGR